MKKELVKKVRDIMIHKKKVVLVNIPTRIGDACGIEYDEDHNSVDVDVIMASGEGLANPAAVTIPVEYLDEKDIEEILKALPDE